jgi:hypothetical protein
MTSREKFEAWLQTIPQEYYPPPLSVVWQARDAEIAELQEKHADESIDKIMKMSDAQINALCAFDGHHPDDEARLGRQAVEIALLKFKLMQAEREAVRKCAEICRARLEEWYSSVAEGSEVDGYESTVLRNVESAIRAAFPQHFADDGKPIQDGTKT